MARASGAKARSARSVTGPAGTWTRMRVGCGDMSDRYSQERRQAEPGSNTREGCVGFPEIFYIAFHSGTAGIERRRGPRNGTELALRQVQLPSRFVHPVEPGQG